MRVRLATGACVGAWLMAWMHLLQLAFGCLTITWATCWTAVLLFIAAGAWLTEYFRFSHRILRIGLIEATVLSPLTIALASHLYVRSGGSLSLGLMGASALAAALTVVAVGIPCFLIGSILDPGSLAELALGGFLSVCLCVGLLFESIGLNLTVELFAAVYAVVVLRAPPPLAPAAARQRGPVAAIAACAALISLTDVIWVRMLGCLFGNSAYVAGLVSALLLFGTAVGAALGRAARDRFPITAVCGLVALSSAAAFALGDKIAIFAFFLRYLEATGFGGQVMLWLLTAIPLVFPAGLAVGVQLSTLTREPVSTSAPLVALCLGLAAGGVLTALVMLPTLGAEWSWRAAVLAAVGLCAATSACPSFRGQACSRAEGGVAVLACLCSLWLLHANGPTVLWRHSGLAHCAADHIEAVRQQLEDWSRALHRTIVWQAEGTDRTVAVNIEDSYALSIDASGWESGRGHLEVTAMAGLLGALLYPDARLALVTELGTGATAGWLAAVDTLQRVDVAVRDPIETQATNFFAELNHGALSNSKVRLVHADARELLRCASFRYDLIVSMPSQLGETGSASMLTREHFQQCARRLDPAGVLILGLCLRDFNRHTLATLYSALHTAFPCVNTWSAGPDTLLLSASRTDVTPSAAALTTEPFGTALSLYWGGRDLPAVMARLVGTNQLAKKMQLDGAVAADSRNPLEFALARGQAHLASVVDITMLRNEAAAVAGGCPAYSVDMQECVEERRDSYDASVGRAMSPPFSSSPPRLARAQAKAAYSVANFAAVIRWWTSQNRGPQDPFEEDMLAESFANLGDERATTWARRMRTADATAVLACLRWKQHQPEAAMALWEEYFAACHRDPTVNPTLMARTMQMMADDTTGSTVAARLAKCLLTPMAARLNEDLRLRILLALAAQANDSMTMDKVLSAYGGNVPWRQEELQARVQVLRARKDSALSQAEADLNRFLKERDMDLWTAP